jgi:hypothetical protein
VAFFGHLGRGAKSHAKRVAGSGGRGREAEQTRNPNADIVDGACEEVVDILENIPSDTERRAATDVGELLGSEEEFV